MLPNNVCPQCKRPDVLNWIHDHKRDRFICAVCSDRNHHEGGFCCGLWNCAHLVKKAEVKAR